MISVPLLQIFLLSPKLSFTILISDIKYEVSNDCDGKISDGV